MRQYIISPSTKEGDRMLYPIGSTTLAGHPKGVTECFALVVRGNASYELTQALGGMPPMGDLCPYTLSGGQEKL